MNPKEAINVLSQVGSNYHGTLQEHNTIQEALKVLNDIVTSNMSEKEPEPDQI